VPFTAQNIIRVQIGQVVISSKVLDKFGHIQNALDSGIEVTSVPKVFQSYFACFGYRIICEFDLSLSDFVILDEFGNLNLLFSDFLALLGVLLVVFLA
jgi:hypothetical protein